MVYFNGVLSVFESIYLGLKITDKLIYSDIVVNPISSSYLSGKTILLTIPGINPNIVNHLLNNGNSVISRIPGYDNRVKLVPYLEKPLFNIQWNGKIIDTISKDNIETDIDFEVDYPKVYFPNIKNPKNTVIDGYSTAIGYLLYQVGQDDIINNALFDNLDVIKCKKGIF